MVKLLKDGKEVRMGKRLGNFITVDEVLDEVDEATGHPGAGRDALRFLILARSHDSPVEFDLAVASAQSVENPVFYAQMTHARMCSILHRAETAEELLPAREAGALDVPHGPEGVLVEKLTLPEERAILAACDAFPELVRDAAEARAPHRVAFWALEFAQAFASYFTRMQRVHDAPILPQKGYRDAHPDWVRTWDWPTTRARLLWLRAVRQVYANALALLGVEAPTRMTRAANEP
jgi:arginyl-tRNA synthetase